MNERATGLLPDWASIDADTGQITGTPPDDTVDGSFDVTITADDGNGGTTSDTFTLNVEATNDGPVVSSDITDSTATEDSAFSLDVSGNFSDVDGDSLSFSADGLPDWASIDAETGEITGTPPNDTTDGSFEVTVTADDGNGGTVTDTFTLNVEASNDGPVVISDIADSTASEDNAFSLDVSGNFSDVDGDS